MWSSSSCPMWWFFALTIAVLRLQVSFSDVQTRNHAGLMSDLAGLRADLTRVQAELESTQARLASCQAKCNRLEDAASLKAADTEKEHTRPNEDSLHSQQFNFGRNWYGFESDVLDLWGKGRVVAMMQHLVLAFQLRGFDGLAFLDVGSGSGLASLAAVCLNASRVLSIDYQMGCVVSTKNMAEKHRPAFCPEAKNTPWEILQGNVLNNTFVDSLGQWDLVYSYGVLHHIGDLWTGLWNVAQLVFPTGLLFFAVHATEGEAPGEHEQWIALKEGYQRAAAGQQNLIVLSYIATELHDQVAGCLADHPSDTVVGGSYNRFHVVFQCLAVLYRDYGDNRGMDFVTDARDWVGGYPYEFVATDAVVRFFAHEVEPKLKVLKISNEPMNSFLLTRPRQWKPEGRALNTFFYDHSLGGFAKSVELNSSEIVEWDTFANFCSLCSKPEWHSKAAYLRLIMFTCDTCLQTYTAELRELVKGERCYVAPVRDETSEKEQTINVMLENSEILGWGVASKDGRFCREGGGARYLFWPPHVASSLLVVFSIHDDADPRISGRVYEVLRSLL